MVPNGKPHLHISLAKLYIMFMLHDRFPITITWRWILSHISRRYQIQSVPILSLILWQCYEMIGGENVWKRHGRWSSHYHPKFEMGLESLESFEQMKCVREIPLDCDFVRSPGRTNEMGLGIPSPCTLQKINHETSGLLQYHKHKLECWN
jgi:hypothetical protein